MKEGLIRLTNEKDIFYDSIEKVYRYRQHCPECGTSLPGCMCYNDLNLLYSDIDEGIADYTCSAKCALLIGDWDELNDVIEEGGWYRKATELIQTISDIQIRDYLEGVYSGYSTLIDFNGCERGILESILNENNLEEDILQHFEIERDNSIEKLTEDEAKEVFEKLTSDYDWDYPHGDVCNT